METPISQQKSEATGSSRDAGGLVQEGQVRLELESSEGSETRCGYSLLVRGVVQPSSVLSSTDPNETVTLLENDTKLVTGDLAGGKVGFIIDGTVVAAEFDEATPTVKLGGAYVDPAQWPTVTEYTGFGPDQEPVEDPFPDSGELGGARDDPLDPEEYVIELDATGIPTPEAYCFDVDGDVLDCAGGPTVSENGDRVYGCLDADSSARITIQGHVTRIDTADGIEFTVSERDKAK